VEGPRTRKHGGLENAKKKKLKSLKGDMCKKEQIAKLLGEGRWELEVKKKQQVGGKKKIKRGEKGQKAGKRPVGWVRQLEGRSPIQKKM